MNSCVFIIPYFGKMNNYFELFLKSCKWNNDFDWLIFTDDKALYNYPKNVTVNYCTFNELDSFIYTKVGFHVNTPYKLCDYKPAYGHIFSSFIKGYQMWGYCDNDLIFGKLNNWITPNKIAQYDKIGILGHLTLIKNSEVHNRIFMDNIDGKSWYKEVFSSKENKFFDEQGGNSINTLFRKRRLKIFYDFPVADIYTLSSKFRLVKYITENKYIVDSEKEHLFIWNNGRIFRYYVINGNLKHEEYAYIHLQKRKMNMPLYKTFIKANEYKIIPNSFKEIRKIPNSIEEFNSIKKYAFNMQLFRVKYLHLKIKLKRVKNYI